MSGRRVSVISADGSCVGLDKGNEEEGEEEEGLNDEEEGKGSKSGYLGGSFESRGGR